ncbi:MAG: hypothetical protein WCK24_00985 [Actinomycetes bacterium]
MPDTWKCPTCGNTLRCGCSSMECSFDYDIRAHVRADLKLAIQTALGWLEPKAVMIYTERVIEDTDV